MMTSFAGPPPPPHPHPHPHPGQVHPHFGPRPYYQSPARYLIRPDYREPAVQTVVVEREVAAAPAATPVGLYIGLAVVGTAAVIGVLALVLR